MCFEQKINKNEWKLTFAVLEDVQGELTMTPAPPGLIPEWFDDGLYDIVPGDTPGSMKCVPKKPRPPNYTESNKRRTDDPTESSECTTSSMK